MTTTSERRRFLGAAASVLAAPGILTQTRAYADDPVIRVGHVSPASGFLAGFSEIDSFVLDNVRQAFADGIENNGKRYKIDIIYKDSRSDPERAAAATTELIHDDKVDLLVAASTPLTVGPVANVAEANQVPCITTNAPWQSYFSSRGVSITDIAEHSFDYTYHFFWGLEDIIATFMDLWNSSGVEKTVGLLYPDNNSASQWANPVSGFPKHLSDAGYRVVEPGLYQERMEDFGEQIEVFRQADCKIITGNMSSADFATFWAQCVWHGFKPNVVSVARALLFPSVVHMLGKRVSGLSAEIWWSPNHPFFSSLTGESAKALAYDYQTRSNRYWIQPLGFKHALFEVVNDVVGRAEDLGDSKAIAAAIKSTSLSTVVGDIDWAKSPIPNISKTPLVSGQWQTSGDELELIITSNNQAIEIPVGGELQIIND